MDKNKNTILIVDDEPQIRKMLNIYLDESNFNVEEADSGKQAIRLSVSLKPDLIILDLGLPDIDGKEVIASIREWSQVPIIVLSVRSLDEEIVAALDAGANDYMTKPFGTSVLLARIRVNLRQVVVERTGEPELTNGVIRMDIVRHEVFLRDEKLLLTPKEYGLLRYFLFNSGRMLTHKQILKDVWGHAHDEDTQYLRVFISQLREKLAHDPSTAGYIITEPGIGYRMESHPVPVSEKIAALENSET
jgi:two-component system, OmpR family, KDP operon response regulator KdpE